MSIRSAQTIVRTFTTESSAGAAVNADVLPTGTLYVNGAADAAAVTVTNLAAGLYKFSVTLPALAIGDAADVVIAATIGGTAAKAPVWGDVRDADLSATGAMIVQSGTAAGQINLTLGGIPVSAGGIVAGSIAAGALNGKGDWSTVGAAMTLTSGERTAIANEVEAQIIDETDSEKVLQAITDKIASVNPSLSGLTIAAIAAGVRDVLVAGAAANSLGAFVSAIKAKTDNIPANPANTTDVLSRLSATSYIPPDNTGIGAALTAAESAETAANQVLTALPTNFSAMRIDQDGFAEVDAHVMEFSISGNTLTVKRADGTTTKYTKSLTTDPAAEPITGST